MEVAFSGAVDHDCSRFDVPYQIFFATGRKSGDDDVGCLEEMLLDLRSSLPMDQRYGGSRAHEHALKRDTDARRTVEDHHGRPLLTWVAWKHVLDRLMLVDER